MKDRVTALVGPVAEKMWVSTFHSACVRILRRDAEQLGYPSTFSIYDQADAVRLTGYVARDLGLDTKKFVPRSVHSHISNLKNELVSTQQALDKAEGVFDRKIAEIYEEYQRRLRNSGAMDFDDLLNVTVELFSTHPHTLNHYQERFQHVLVDEYQDTNPAQNDIVLKLGDKHQNVFRSRRQRPIRIRFEAPTFETSSNSKKLSPTPASSYSIRTIDPPKPSSTPPTQSSPTTLDANPKTSGPTNQLATKSSSTEQTTKLKKLRGWSVNFNDNTNKAHSDGVR